ncbi:MAG: dTDP-glucose 4,6-dehydratase [Geminicoccaceae bacterium]|nr:dTDP-glucose 4,6-dehydratase [Geminicoccaceae bacterium]MCX8101729.1 dTDP-glucose 4,6-dehydratase [Geminicoccaceae bacterium]MDW8371702.1 dTDP-glucose 4,6-dehydratase [Geminicoccaceae bacterium]
MKLLVTGGCGFIGSAVVRRILRTTDWSVVNLDKLGYAAEPRALGETAADPRYRLVVGDIADARLLARLFEEERPQAVLHLAAESHVDRSIDGPEAFLATNVVGTFRLLEAALAHWRRLAEPERARFRFHHVSTDEVFGALGPDDPPFRETTAYDPRSPYAASKAASDHFVRAFGHTFGLPVLLSNASNNYGPWQFPEKLIPLALAKALAGEPIPLYGRGDQVRDWLHVEDHAAALLAILTRGEVGRTYLVGARAERTNLALVHTLCAILDELLPDSPHRPHARLVRFVADRPGHDRRYAIDPSRLERELGWRPSRSLEEGLRETVRWYLENRAWLAETRRRYDGRRLGLGTAAEGRP